MRFHLIALAASVSLVTAIALTWAQSTPPAAPAAPLPLMPQAPANPQPATITVDAAAPRTTVSPELYGLFFEEISHAGEGGLYAELVQNRDFEETNIPDGWKADGTTLSTSLGWKTTIWFDNDLPAWSLIKEGTAEGSMAKDNANPLNARNPHSLRLTATRTGDAPSRLAVANSGYWGMNVQAGQSYDGSFYARLPAVTGLREAVPLTFSLESADGKTTYARTTIPDAALNDPNGTWHKFTFNLQATGSDPKARLVISPGTPTTLWLECVSLFPHNTFKNHGMRLDLAQMLVDLKPAFLRFPGGCVVEGVMHNRIRWEDSVGDISQRLGEFSLWGYYNHYGMGYHEFLQLCEDLDTEAMYVCNAGMSCELRRPYELATDANLHLYIEDTLNALEYAMGPTTSKYGAMRAANGHPAPFKIKYVEIGNENFAANYEQHHYRAFYDAIKAKYPDVITIADTRIPFQPIEVVDDHYYVAPQRFFGMSNLYDTADRKGPKIYVGEYAVNKEVGSGNLLGALSEAVFAMMMERNSDIVIMTSYAPLFENVNRADWPVNLIRFDSSRVIGRSSYYVQKLMGNNRPDVILKTAVDSAKLQFVTTQMNQLYAECGLDEKAHELILKVVNPTPAQCATTINLKGLAPSAAGKTRIITLSHADPKAENTLDNPKTVIPVDSTTTISTPTFTYDFAPNSFTILRIPLQ